MSKSKSSVPSTAVISKGVSTQLEQLRVSDTASTKALDNTTSMKIDIPWKYNTGGTPIIKVDGASLGRCGKTELNHRGINIKSWVANNSTLQSASLKICLDREKHSGVAELLKGVLEKVVDSRDPIRNSKWYENKFPVFGGDGTKVYNATRQLQNLQEFATMDVSDDFFNSPMKTFGKFLYSENEDDAKWYTEVAFPSPKKEGEDINRIVLYDDKGKVIGTRTDGHGNEVYTKGGILLSNPKRLNDLVSSKFFKDNIWKCTCNIRPYMIQFKYSTDDQSVYPLFKFRTFGDVRFQIDTRENDPNQLTSEQLLAAFNNDVYEGVSQPSRKKRKVVKPKKVVVKQGKIESEVISESEVEGDDDDDEE